MPNGDAQTFSWHLDTDIDDDSFGLRGRKLFFIISIFSIVLLFTALFLCARRICRRHSLLSNSFNSIHAPPSQGLDPDAIKKLPIILHQAPPPSGTSRAAEETECCICLSAFKDGEKLKVLPGCDHSFHCECVGLWLMNHSSCPLCRASLKLDSNSNSSFPGILIEEPPIRF